MWKKIPLMIVLLFTANALFAEEDNLEQGLFTFAGYTDLTYTDTKDGGNGLAYKLAPIFLIQPSDRIHIEAEFEFGINDQGDVDAEVEYLDLHYFATDTITLTVGKFLLPFAYFGPNLHPSWINKLSTQPAIYGGHHGDGLIEGLLPVMSDVGLAYQQVVPFSSRHRLYIDGYVVNGAGLGPVTDHGHDEAAAHDDDTAHQEEDADHDEALGHEDEVAHEEGSDHDETDADHDELIDQLQAFTFALPELEFEGKLHDNNSDKAFGGRIGYAYLPGFEAGYSYYRGAYDDAEKLDFRADAIDLTYNGRYFTLRGEYIRTRTDALGSPVEAEGDHVDDAAHDDEVAHDEDADHAVEAEHAEEEADHAIAFPTTTFERDGWYVQANWQLRSFDSPLLNPVELVVRHSQVNQIADAKRWTLGVNYWWKPSSVFKLSFDTTELASGEKINRVLAQFSHGF